MQQFLDTDIPEPQTARESVMKNEKLTNANPMTKSYDLRKVETPHPKLSSYLSGENLRHSESAQIKTGAFLMKTMPHKNSLYASKAMKESMEVARIVQERKNVSRFSQAFSSTGRDRSMPHYIGVV
jgi:hypothetical protein